MLRDNLAGLSEPMLSSARACPLALCTDRNESSDDRPQDALKIPARQGGIYTLAENVASPFHAEPPHVCDPLALTTTAFQLLYGDTAVPGLLNPLSGTCFALVMSDMQFCKAQVR